MQSENDIWFEYGSVPFQNECVLEMTYGLNFEIINSLTYTSRYPLLGLSVKVIIKM